MIIIERLLDKYLPIYIIFWPTNYWLAMWSAPVRFKGKWKINKEYVPCCHWESYWQALRITIRKGSAHSQLIKVIKKGTF